MNIPKFSNPGLDIGSVLPIAAAALIGLPLLGELLKPKQQGTHGTAKPTDGIHSTGVNW